MSVGKYCCMQPVRDCIGRGLRHRTRKAKSLPRLRVYGEAEGTTASRDEESGDWTFTDGEAEIELQNPDFNILSYRSNLVMRWEWRPGSTLFLVWQANRSGFNQEGEFVAPSDLYDALTSEGENTLAIKFTYWLPI